MTETGVLARGYAYLLPGFPLAIAAFVVAVTGFSVGVGTLVVWLGLPVLAGTLAAASGFAGVERALAGRATGRELVSHYREPRGRGIGRLWSRLADPQSWRDLLHAIVAFPVHVVTFVLAFTWGVAGLGSALAVTWQWAIPRDAGPNGLFGLITGVDSAFGEIVLSTVVGVAMLLTLPPVVRGLVAVQAGLARGLLTNETVARRLDDDPARARPLVAEAIEQNREALAELRALSRGIAPPILADRGLGPALAAAAARCPVQVTLDVALPTGERLAAAVENTAYFVVTEALTNVAKHAHATLCTVAVSTDGERVLVQVCDDGRGGAHLGKGHGLAGLADRLATVEGALDLVSPAGGPTVLTAEIPLTGVGD